MSLTNSQYNSLMRGYQERQQSRSELIRTRKRALYEAVPRLSAIDGEIADLALLSVRSRLFDQNEAPPTEGVFERLQQLSSDRKRLIAEAGYPADYLDPPYTCPDCKDTGFIDGEPCHCYIQASCDLVASWSDINPVGAVSGFSDFSLDYYDESLSDPMTGESARAIAEHALSDAKRFAEGFGGARGGAPRDGMAAVDGSGAVARGESIRGEVMRAGNLLIYGSTGVGKTHLSNCIAAELRQRGFSVLYLTTFRLFNILEERRFGAKRGEDDPSRTSYKELFSCDLLIIDDLGTELSNSFTTSGLFELLNERILSGRSTVISSNLALAEIKDTYSERMFSRIMEHYRMIRLYGEDIRLKKKLGGDINAA